MRRRLPALLTAATLAVVPAGAAVAAPPGGGPFPETIALPDGFQPEGIEAGRGTSFFVGSLAGGAIYRGDLRTGEGEVLVEPTGGVVVGVLYEAANDRLWVAGGPTGGIRAYDATTGELLATYVVPGSGFLNDVAIADGAVYVTDSAQQQLAVVPLGAGGALPDAATTLPLTGEIQYTPGFNANGIVATAGGRWLVLVQSSTGTLFRVDPATGETAAIDLGGASLPNGDGLELRGSTLYAVQNRLNQVAVVDLDGQALTGEVTSVITDSDLDVPTTVAFAAGRLWAVNARFGTPPGPGTEYDVVRLPLR